MSVGVVSVTRFYLFSRFDIYLQSKRFDRIKGTNYRCIQNKKWHGRCQQYQHKPLLCRITASCVYGVSGTLIHICNITVPLLTTYWYVNVLLASNISQWLFCIITIHICRVAYSLLVISVSNKHTSSALCGINETRMFQSILCWI